MEFSISCVNGIIPHKMEVHIQWKHNKCAICKKINVAFFSIVFYFFIAIGYCDQIPSEL